MILPTGYEFRIVIYGVMNVGCTLRSEYNYSYLVTSIDGSVTVWDAYPLRLQKLHV